MPFYFGSRGPIILKSHIVSWAENLKASRFPESQNLTSQSDQIDHIFKGSAVQWFPDAFVPECGPRQACRSEKIPACARVLRFAAMIHCGWRTVVRICRRQRFP